MHCVRFFVVFNMNFRHQNRSAPIPFIYSKIFGTKCREKCQRMRKVCKANYFTRTLLETYVK